MNGYVIFNAAMTPICVYNFYLVMKTPNAPAWTCLLLFFFIIVCTAMTGFVYTPGDN